MTTRKTVCAFVEQDIDDAALHSAIAALTEQELAVVGLAFWDGLSPDEIGAELGLSGGRVQSIRRKALAKLRQILDRAEDAAA